MISYFRFNIIHNKSIYYELIQGCKEKENGTGRGFYRKLLCPVKAAADLNVRELLLREFPAGPHGEQIGSHHGFTLCAEYIPDRVLEL